MLTLEATRVLAVCVLGAVFAGIVVWLTVLVRRLPYTTAQSTTWLGIYALARLLWRPRICGRLPVRRDQGAVLVSNHRGPVDPVFLQMTLGRIVHWMVAREYYELGSLRWLFRLAEMFPANRGGIDTAATRRAIRYCREGELVGMFPEGRINTTAELLLPGRAGAAKVALAARVPVVPYYVSGTPYIEPFWKCLLTPAHARVKVGRPIDLSAYYGRENDREVLIVLTQRFLAEIAKLAGNDDYEPQVAGRRRSTIGVKKAEP
jgi:1-acyl-sn-glycerol-3-phosphate acyltransferase